MLNEKLYHEIKNQLVEIYPEDRWWAVYEGRIPIDEAKREYQKFLAERGWEIYANVRRRNRYTREHIEWLAKRGRDEGENYEVLCKKLVNNTAFEVELFNVIRDLTDGKADLMSKKVEAMKVMGSRFTTLREMKGETLGEFAVRLGIKGHRLAQIEQFRRLPTSDECYRLSEATKIPFHKITFGCDDFISP